MTKWIPTCEIVCIRPYNVFLQSKLYEENIHKYKETKGDCTKNALKGSLRGIPSLKNKIKLCWLTEWLKLLSSQSLLLKSDSACFGLNICEQNGERNAEYIFALSNSGANWRCKDRRYRYGCMDGSAGGTPPPQASKQARRELEPPTPPPPHHTHTYRHSTTTTITSKAA